MGKLVHDRTPHVLASEPLRLAFTQADPAQRRHLLLAKLLEEASEWLLAGGDHELAGKELADLQQVLWALCELDSLDPEQVLADACAHPEPDEIADREGALRELLMLAGRWLTSPADSEVLRLIQQRIFQLAHLDQVTGEFVLGAALLKQGARGGYDELTIMTVERDDTPAQAPRTLPIWATKPPGWTAPPSPDPEPDPEPKPDPAPAPASARRRPYGSFGGACYSG